MNLCVYGAASDLIDKSFIEAGEALGEEMAKRGHNLVFGGGGACGAGEEDEFLPVYSNEKDGF